MDRKNIFFENDLGLKIIVVALWLGTAVAGFLLILPVIDSILRIFAALWWDYGYFGEAYSGGVVTRQFFALALAILYIIMVVGGAEYHSRHFNESGSWKFIARSIAGLITLYLFSVLI
jgi:hypothetical protein